MSALIDKLKDSTLGLQGNTPEPLNLTESKIEKEVFDNSVLDLNGKTPITYKNTAPEGRTF